MFLFTQKISDSLKLIKHIYRIDQYLEQNEKLEDKYFNFSQERNCKNIFTLYLLTKY